MDQDHLVRCITGDGCVTAMAVDSTQTVQTAQSLHHASAVASAALGRLMTGALLMGSVMKNSKATVTVRVNGGGPLGAIIASADNAGHVRGYAMNPEVELPLNANGKLNVGEAVGREGVLNVVRDMGSGEPYVGQIELVSGEIAEDLTEYYARSEQTPTVCALGVLTDKGDHTVILAGGLIIQLLPTADEEAIAKLEKNLATLEPVTTMMAKGLTPEAMCRHALEGFDVEVLDESEVHYACTCSLEKVKNAIAGLPVAEIRSLAEDENGTEANCPFCGRKYRLTSAELESLANAKETRKKAESKKDQKN